jgi:signal transduction histidine kinase
MRILVADDDPINRRVLQATLQQWGHEVLLACDGLAALATLQAEGAPRIAILDWMMPGLTGPELCARIRESPAIRGSYAILLTGRDAREDAVAALAQGADDFMTKPFDRDLLRARLSVGERVLSLQGALAESRERLRDHAASLERVVAERTDALRLAHDELAAAGRLKDRILGCVNHELRTPVTKLLLVSQTLERARPGAALPPSMTAVLVEQSKHLAALVDQVLSAKTLLQAGPGAPGGEADVATMLEAVAFMSAEQAAARDVRIEILAPSQHGPAPARAEASALTLVLAPLLDNAVKFTRKGSSVRVAWEARADRVRVTVTDDGPGVAECDRESIFAEFDQGSGDHLVAKPKGLGLGLAIARRLARRLGGEVGLAADAAGSGRGSTFFAELPLGA